MTTAGAVMRDDVSAFLREVEQRLVADLPDLERRADRLLELYRGIPTRVDVFDVLNLYGNEDRHTDFLAWLLDVRGQHCLGDRFLRSFLALTGHPTARRLARSPQNLEAAVRTQISLPSAGMPDLAIAVPGAPGVVIVCEAKIGSGLTYGASREPQTTSYRRWVENHSTAELLQRFGPMPIDASGRFEPVLVFLRAQRSQEAEPGVEELRYRYVDYLSIERVLGRLVLDCDLPPSSRSLVQQFRTSILAGGLPGLDPLASLRRLRLLRSVQDPLARTHLGAARLRQLLDNLDAPGTTHG